MAFAIHKMKAIDMERTLQVHLEDDEKLITISTLTFHSFWNIVIGVQTYSLTIMMTYILAYGHMPSSLILFIFLFDLFYLADFIGGLIYLKNWKTQRFLPYKPKDWKIFLIDFVSLLPLAYAYDVYVASDSKTLLVFRILLQNRCLRIYRIFVLFSFYDLQLRDTYKHLILMAIKFIALSLLFSHIMSCVWYNIPNSLPCEDGDIKCFIWREASMFKVLTSWSGEKKALSTDEERILVIVTFILGLCLIYGDLIPHLLLIFLRVSRTKNRYLQKYLKLERFLTNIGVDQPLNNKIEKYFHHFWLSGTTGQEMESLMTDLPLALKKEVFTDIYWDALRHSDIFRDVSRCCKRSISLAMTAEYCQEGDIYWAKGSFKNGMIYLVEGVMELMAEENETSPIMSFSSGTVLGEISLFRIVESQAILRCKTLCELHTLSLRDAHRVLLNYPKDRNIVFQKLNKRLAIAKITQWRKLRLGVSLTIERDLTEGQPITMEENEDEVKWVKMQWRAIREIHERYLVVIRAREAGLRLSAWRKQYEVRTRIDAVSNFMDLMVLSDVFEEKIDVICLKTTFPWAIDPRSGFLTLWRTIVIIAAIISSVMYPYCAGWMDDIPISILTISIACNLIFIIDLAMLLMTAVTTKHGIITNFTSILIHCLKKPTFTLDIIAAIPFQLYKHVQTTDAPIGFFLLPYVLKAHVFLKPTKKFRDFPVFLCVVKNIFFLVVLIYWFATIIQLMSFACFPMCGFFKWDVVFAGYEDEFTIKNLLSVSLAMSTALSLEDEFTTKNQYYLITLTVCWILFFFWMCCFLCDFYTVYSIKISNQLQFAVLYNRIMQYLESVHIPPPVHRRVVRIIRFQWFYNTGDDVLTKIPAIALAPKNLRQEIYSNSIYRTLRRCPLFKYESAEFIYDNIERCEIIAIPRGTVLVDYGIRCNRIHLLHKGYCQTSSFLTKDVSRGLGSPILLKPGDFFPPLAAFATAPSPIVVTSLTDCVIIVFQLEELLKTMVIHNIFHDLVTVLNSSDYLERLSRHTLAMIPSNVQFNPPVDKKEEYDLPFRGLGLFGTVLKRVLLNKDIFFDKNERQKQFYYIITTVYMCYVTFAMFLWPLCFGLLIYQARYIIPVLLACKLYVAFYIYLQFHVPYFDKRGLLIKHPLYTMTHYITTNFFIDILMNIPLYEYYRYIVVTPGVAEKETTVLLTILQKLLGLLPISWYLSGINKESNVINLSRNMRALLIFAAIMNAVTNYGMFLSVILKFNQNGRVVGFVPLNRIGWSNCWSRMNDDAVQSYVMITFWIFNHLTGNDSCCETYAWKEKIWAHLFSLIGAIVVWTFYGLLASQSIVSDALRTTYQERMQSFIEFLISSKTDDKIIERSIIYFEHQWSRSWGQNLEEICQRLPDHLHEALAFPLYRSTLRHVSIFANADESFYGMLSINLDLVHFSRGTMILSRGHVQSDLFFIHQGKCFVFDWFLTLDRGSLIGDLHRTGHIVNKVFALTHVELLRINSDKFFSILNNYYDIESRFFAKVRASENFIESNYVRQTNQLRPVDSRDVLNAFDLQSKVIGFEDESYFEDPENAMTERTLARKPKSRLRKHYTFTIYPGTFAMFVYNVVNVTVAFLTVIIMPNLLFFGGLTKEAFIITAVLDAAWALGVFATFRVGVEDKDKGDVITDGKFLAKKYLLSWDGFFLRLISCVPFELFPVLVADRLEDVDHVLVSGLRSLRFLRVYFLVKYVLTETGRLKVSDSTRYLAVIIFYIIFIHFMVLLFYLISSKADIVGSMTPLELGRKQLTAIVLVYHFVLNMATSTNMSTVIPETRLEMSYFTIFSVMSIQAKALIIKYILMIKHIHNQARGKHKTQIALLEGYLKKNDLSPSILKEVIDYKQNLLIVARSENNPTFLLAAPASLRLAIMSDLYLIRLKRSPIFREVSPSFLKLLVCRLKRQIFFPGQKIVEKGDVDHTMYFIHKGEVYVVDQTDDEAYIEFVVDRMFAGDEFGQAEGLSLAKPHKNTYRARTIVEMLTLHSADWLDLRKIFPHIYIGLIKTSKKLY